MRSCQTSAPRRSVLQHRCERMAGDAQPRREVFLHYVRTRSAAKADASSSSSSAPPPRRSATAIKESSAKGPANKSVGVSSRTERMTRLTETNGGSPLRRSGRIGQNNKSDNHDQNEQSSRADESPPGSRSRKKGALLSKRNSREVVSTNQEASVERPAKIRKLLDARAYRALFKSLLKNKKDTRVLAGKHRRRDVEECDMSCGMYDTIENDSLRKDNCSRVKDCVAEHMPDSITGNDSFPNVLMEGEACGKGKNHLHVQQQSIVDKCKTTAVDSFSSVNPKQSLDLIQTQTFTEASDCKVDDRQMISKCSSCSPRLIVNESMEPKFIFDGNSHQSCSKDMKRQADNGGADNGESCFFSMNAIGSVEEVACVSEEDSVTCDGDFDGTADVLSFRVNSTKNAGDSDVSVTTSKDKTSIKDIPSVGVNCSSLPERENIDDVVERISPTETKKDDCICSICKQPGSQLFCMGRACKRSYHMSCVDPPLIEPPLGIWLCLCCVRKKLDLGIYSVSEGIDSIWDCRVVEVVQHNFGVQQEKQYLVKYQGLAHVHNRWIPEKEVLSEVPDLVVKYNEKIQNVKTVSWRQEWCKPQRLLQKRLIMPPELLDEYFYCDGTAAFTHCYYEWFVKWTGLGYEHATWEFESSLFFDTNEAELLIKEYECRHDEAKKVYDSSRSEKVNQMRKSQVVKLSSLPDEVGFEMCYLNSVNQLRECWHKGWNAVLVNDQERIVKVIIFIATLLSDACHPFLLITSSVSLSLWESELMRLMQNANFLVYDGVKENRNLIRKLDFYDESGHAKFKVLLSHADAISEDFEAFDCLRWEVVIVDDCQLPEVSAHLAEFKLFSTEVRLLLSGGPLKENIAEYLDMLSYLYSNGKQNLTSSFPTDSSIQTTKLALVKEQFYKYCINESKQDQSKFLEFWVPVCFSDVQLEQYCAILVFNSMILCSPSKVDRVGAFREILLSARKCCDHPFLADSSVNGLLTKGLPQEEYLDVGVHASGKLRVLDKILQNLKNNRLRVLILFQVTIGEGKVHIGDILDDYLRYRFSAESYERVDSGLAMTKKQAALQNFNNKEMGRFVFLLENRACLPSIKLSSVDAVIIYGSDWNPLNDMKSLQRISISSLAEQIKVFRLYSIFTLEEMVLLRAKREVTLESNIPNISRSIGHSLLRWGASHLFKKLNEFHQCNNSSSICLEASCEKPLLNDIVLEILHQIYCTDEIISSNSCSIISKVSLSGLAYSRNIPLFGETEEALDEDQPHVFWSKLLEGRKPLQMKYVTGFPQRVRRKAQNFECPLQSMDRNGELKKKHKKLSSIRIKNSIEAPNSLQASSQNKIGCPTVSVTVNDNLYINEGSVVDSGIKESNMESRILQRNLYVRLKTELAKLCAALQFSNDVKNVAEVYLDYILNHHHVSQEPESLLQAFIISLCWRAAHSLNIELDHKESLLVAQKSLFFECNVEQVDTVYMVMMKKVFSPPTNEPSTHLDPDEICVAGMHEICTSSGQQNVSGFVKRRSVEFCSVKSERDSDISTNNTPIVDSVLNGCHSLKVTENVDMHMLEDIQVECSLADRNEPVKLLSGGSGSPAPRPLVPEVNGSRHVESNDLGDGRVTNSSRGSMESVLSIDAVHVLTEPPLFIPEAVDAENVGELNELPFPIPEAVDADHVVELAELPLSISEAVGVESVDEHNELPFPTPETVDADHVVELAEPPLSIPEAVDAENVGEPNELPFLTPETVDADHVVELAEPPLSITEAIDTENVGELNELSVSAPETVDADHVVELAEPPLSITEAVDAENVGEELNELPVSAPETIVEEQGGENVELVSTPAVDGEAQQPAVTAMACMQSLLPSDNQTDSLPIEDGGLPVRNQNSSGLNQLDQCDLQGLILQLSRSQTNTLLQPSRPFSQINARLPPPNLHPDPLQNELLRINKGMEHVNQSCEDLKFKLRVEYEIELEKLKKKYELLFQNVDVECAEKLKILDMVYNKVALNRALAEEFRSEVHDYALNHALAKAAALQAARSQQHKTWQLQFPPSMLSSASSSNALSSRTASQRNHPAMVSITPSSQRTSATAMAPISSSTPVSSVRAIVLPMLPGMPISSPTNSQRSTIASTEPVAVPILSSSTTRVTCIGTQRISSVGSHAPRSVPIPSVPSISTFPGNSAPTFEPQSTCASSLSHVLPPPLQVVSHASALFSPTSKTPPFTGTRGCGVELDRVPWGIVYRSPAPHLSFCSPSNGHLSNQSSCINGWPNMHHSLAFRSPPPSVACEQAMTSSTPVEATYSSPVPDFPQVGANQSEGQISVRSSENSDRSLPNFVPESLYK